MTNDLVKLGSELPEVQTEREKLEADLDRELVKQIAMDIGKEVVAYIEVMHPQAIAATSSTFKLSVRNCIYGEDGIRGYRVTQAGRNRQVALVLKLHGSPKQPF